MIFNKLVVFYMFKWIFLITFANATYGAENRDNIQLESRKHFEKSLDQIKEKVYSARLPLIQSKYNHFRPNIFISYAWDEDIKPWVDKVLSKDLSRIGFDVLYDQQGIMVGGKISGFEEKVSSTTYAVVLCTPQYLKRYKDHAPDNPSKHTGVGREMQRIVQRDTTDNLKGTILPVYRKGDFAASVPDKISHIAAFDFQNDDKYYENFFILCQKVFLFESNDAEPIKGIRKDFFSLYVVNSIEISINTNYNRTISFIRVNTEQFLSDLRININKNNTMISSRDNFLNRDGNTIPLCDETNLMIKDILFDKTIKVMLNTEEINGMKSTAGVILGEPGHNIIDAGFTTGTHVASNGGTATTAIVGGGIAGGAAGYVAIGSFFGPAGLFVVGGGYAGYRAYKYFKDPKS